jgi:hypothetical protein
VKMFLFVVGFIGSVFFGVSATSRAAPPGGGFRGGGFQGGFIGRNASPAFAMGRGVRRDFAFQQNRFFDRRGFAFRRNRFFERGGHRFFVQQAIWPFYWYPYYGLDYYPWDTSYLDYGPDNDYNYGSDSVAPVQPEYSQRTATPGPLVVVINQGNSRSTDNPGAGHANSSYGSTGADDRQRIAAQGTNEQAGMPADPVKSVSPALPDAVQAALEVPRPVPKPQPGSSDKLVLVSWLNDNGKDVIYVQDVATNEVQRVTSEPNKENFRIVEVHPDADPKAFEAIISNGSEQIPVKFPILKTGS